MARTAGFAFTSSVYATNRDGQEIEIFRQDTPPDSSAIVHRKVETIVELNVGRDSPGGTPRSRILVKSFDHATSKSKTNEYYVRETPAELMNALNEVLAEEPEIWDGARKQVDALIARIVGGRRRGGKPAPA